MSWPTYDNQPARRTQALRRGRVSLPGARYFITLSAVRPTAALTMPRLAAEIQRLSTDTIIDDAGRLLCSTIMPDHVHLLLELGGRLTVGQLIGKLKALSRPALAAEGAAWQRDFFEHRLRPDDPANAYARYVFLNPYRAALLDRRSVWPWWVLGTGVEFDFTAMLDCGQYPPTEWLGEDLSVSGLCAERLGPD